MPKHTDVQLKDEFDAIKKKMFRYGITSKLYNIDTLFGDADAILFKKACTIEHSLHHLLPVKLVKPINIALRKRGHCYNLPLCKRDHYRYSFIPR